MADLESKRGPYLGLKSGQSLADTGGFVYRTQAPAADLDLDVPAILEQGLFVDIGKEAGLGVAVGVADVIAAHSGLVANIASHGGCCSLYAMGF